MKLRQYVMSETEHEEKSRWGWDGKTFYITKSNKKNAWKMHQAFWVDSVCLLSQVQITVVAVLNEVNTLVF